MQRFGRTSFVVLALGLAGCGRSNDVTAQSAATPTTTSAPSEPTDQRQCRSLKMVGELADGLDLSDPLAAMLWSDVGECEARSGDFDAARRRIQVKETAKAEALLIIAKAKIGVALAKALAAADRLEEAERAMQQIPTFQTDQRCIAYAEVAQIRAMKGHAEAATRLWGLAERAVADEHDVKRRTESELAIIRSLADAGRPNDAKKRAASLEAKSDDRRGWAPVAEKLAVDGDSVAASKIIKAKLTGANPELYRFIAKVAPAGELTAARSALREMDDAALAATACHVLAVEMARQGHKDLAVAQLKESWTYMDQAKPDAAQTERILLSSIDPSAVLAGVPETLVVCEEFQKKFSPHISAEAYRRLATHCPPNAKEEARRFLELADRLAQTVRDPVDQTACIQRVARTRSTFLGEDKALQAATQIKGTLNRGFALLGIAEGQLFPETK